MRREVVDRHGHHTDNHAGVDNGTLHPGRKCSPIGSTFTAMDRVTAEPSFAHEIGSAQRTLANPMLRILDKTVCRQVLEAQRVPLPQRHREIGTLSELRAASNLPHRYPVGYRLHISG
jgi:hypothetical protein